MDAETPAGAPSGTPYAGPRPFGWEIEWLKLATLLWIILAVVVSIKTIVQPTRRTVYPVFAVGSRHWWQDRPLHANYGAEEHVDIYRYSPTFAIAFTPLALLDDRAGGVLWNLMAIGLYVWALRKLAEELLPGEWPPWRVGVFLCLALVGSVRGIWAAQSNGLLLALVVFSALCIRKRRWWSAAWLLAGAVFIKVWPIAAAMLLVACWPKKLVGRFAAAMAVLALVPYLTRPWDVVNMQYAQWYASAVGVQQTRWPGIRDFWTILDYLDLTSWDPLYYLIMLSTAAATCGWVLWRKSRTLGFWAGDVDAGPTTAALLTAVVAVWVSWQLLFGPGSERLTYQIMAPVATWGLLASWQARRGRWLTVPAWLMVGILGTGDLERLLRPIWPGSPTILPLGVLVFLLWLIPNPPCDGGFRVCRVGWE